MVQPTFFLLSLLVITLLHGIHAVDYTVTNRAETTSGGQIFNNQIGAEYAKQTMTSATDFIWRLFQQNTPADRKEVPRVPLFINDMEPNEAPAYSTNNEIHINDEYLSGIRGDIKRDFNGIIYHEMTHVWQWDGRGQVHSQSRGGLIDGIADFVRLKANLAPENWGPPGQGSQWFEGYRVTAQFLDYCNDLRNGFVAELNKKMRESYSDNFFMELLGKSVEQLWTDYKAKYGN
ncbi:hypothetical protein Ddye_003537 [Dipteronia dyeriana]|uniref:Plant basic secretory protein (BSP) family protein n=1 Tax=Dipteronia dyeriana TaxID=168575 RepID=A0AAE0CW34_9ROSI|nr:hypothetical protein Ddye_003537 [Dipteronia dyeriana]